MTPIAQAIHDVAEGREERFGHNGLWRVYRDGDNVMFENMAENEPAVVVCTVTMEGE